MSIWADLRLARRGLAREPGFTAVALLTLACAIGANAAIFSIANGLLLKPLPLPGSARLMKLLRRFPERDSDALTALKFFYWRDHARAFSAIAAYESLGTGYNLAGEGAPERIVGSPVSAEFFAAMGEGPALGRGFLPAEDRPGAPPAVVLSDGLWHRRFGGDPRVLGRRLRLNGELYTVVGVMPAGFRFPSRAELWVPFRLDPLSRSRESYIEAVGRLRPGVSPAAAQADLDVVARHFAAAHPDHVRDREGVRVLPLQEYLYGSLRPALLVLLAAVGAVLLIACGNLVSLELARAVARRREIAVRTVLGAGPARLLVPLLAESLLLGLGGGALGLVLAAWSLPILVAASPLPVDRLANIGIDGGVLGFTLALCLLSTVLCGLAPGLQALRRDPWAPLQESSRGAAGGRAGTWTRRLLVAAEVAVALVLATGTMLLARSFVGLLRTAPGFSSGGVVTAKLSLPAGRYGSAAALDRLAAELLPRVSALPGARDAALVSTLPLEDGPPTTFTVEGLYRGGGSGEGIGIVQYRAVTPGFFRTLGVDVLRGRAFDGADRRGGRLVAVINEAAARRYWPGRSPLGARITLGAPSTPELADPAPRTIVGVAGDVREAGLDEQAPPIAYVPVAQMPDPLAATFVQLLPFSLAVRAGGAAPALAPQLRRAVAAVDPEQPLTDVRAMDDIVAGSLGPRRFTATLLGLLSLLALALAALGIYGVLAYLVQQRRREIGVRMALGAASPQVLGLVLRQGMAPVAAGIAAGLTGAFALSRLLGNLLYGVGAHDPASFASAPAALALVAILACLIPARRASRVDPVVVLREE